MVDFLENRRYFLYPFTVNITKAYDGLSGLVRNELGQDPRCGDVFIFFNKTRMLMKMLYWDGEGYVIYGKRMEYKRFQVPSGRVDDLGFYITPLQLLQLIRGIRMETVFRKTND
jgi:transposase